MKRLLLDTQALLWWLADDPRLGKEARSAISESRNDVYVSAASNWEISIKKSVGKLATPDDIDRDQGDPVSSTLVKIDPASATGTGYSYHADFLEPGEYRVAFVCAGGVSPDGGTNFDEPADDPDQDDQLSFTLAAETAVVFDDQTVRIDF